MGGKAGTKKPPPPPCKGWNFRVFTLGAKNCSLCGWDRSAYGERQ